MVATPFSATGFRAQERARLPHDCIVLDVRSDGSGGGASSRASSAGAAPVAAVAAASPARPGGRSFKGASGAAAAVSSPSGKWGVSPTAGARWGGVSPLSPHRGGPVFLPGGWEAQTPPAGLSEAQLWHTERSPNAGGKLGAATPPTVCPSASSTTPQAGQDHYVEWPSAASPARAGEPSTRRELHLPSTPSSRTADAARSRSTSPEVPILGSPPTGGLRAAAVASSASPRPGRRDDGSERFGDTAQHGNSGTLSRNEGEPEQPRPWTTSSRSSAEAPQSRSASSAATEEDGPYPGTETFFEFEVELMRGSPEQPLGLDVVHHDSSTLLVSRINAGPVVLWNRLNPERSVQAGDQIVAVDGQRGSSDFLVQNVRACASPRLGLRQVLEFEVAVPKVERLGLEVCQMDQSLRLLLIGPGPFHEWNAKAGAHHTLRLGDHIVEANGVRGAAPDLLASIRGSQETVRVVVRRGGAARRIHMPPPRLSAAVLASAQAALPQPSLAEAPSSSDDEVERPPKAGHCAITICE